MADTKLSALTAITGLNLDRTADYLLVYDASATTDKKTLVGEAAIAFSNATGQVLQVVCATDAGNTTLSPSLTNLNVAAFAITPKSTSSHLLIECQFYGSEQSASGMNSIASFCLYDVQAGANIGTTNTLAVDSTSAGGSAVIVPCCIRAYIANTVLTQRTFQLRASTNDATSAAGAQFMVGSITEIKD